MSSKKAHGGGCRACPPLVDGTALYIYIYIEREREMYEKRLLADSVMKPAKQCKHIESLGVA